jgi:hypothetical protein
MGSRMAIKCAEKLIEQIESNITEQGLVCYLFGIVAWLVSYLLYVVAKQFCWSEEPTCKGVYSTYVDILIDRTYSLPHCHCWSHYVGNNYFSGCDSCYYAFILACFIYIFSIGIMHTPFLNHSGHFVFCLGTVYAKSPDTATLLGLLKQKSVFTPICELREKADFVLVNLPWFCSSISLVIISSLPVVLCWPLRKSDSSVY